MRKQESYKGEHKFMLEVFKKAIPEITEKAEIFFVDRNPWAIPSKAFPTSISSPAYIDLKEYDIPGPYGSRYTFSIARYIPDVYPPREIVLVLRIPPEELPPELLGGEYYIKEIQKTRYIK